MYDPPAVKLVPSVSVFAMMIEFALVLMLGETDDVVEPLLELPVDVRGAGDTLTAPLIVY